MTFLKVDIVVKESFDMADDAHAGDGEFVSNDIARASSVRSRPLPLRDATVGQGFWGDEQELVRTQVLPFQWCALNDNVPGAAPSYCMHNFRAAAAQNRRRTAARSQGDRFVPPVYTDRGFNVLPDDPERPDPDRFYGFVFQDTDFSKWIEAVGYSLAHHPDAELEARADAAIDIVCAAQQENGYLDTYYILNGMDRHFTNLKDHHELYCMGHLIEGAVAYYEGTGKTRLLHAAQGFADYVASVFGTEPGRLRGYPGHEIAEMALVRLYEVTNERRYLDLAAYFVDERGRAPLYFEVEDRTRAKREGATYVPNDNQPMPYAYYQAHEPVVDQREAVGHAVRAGYLYSGVADVARLTENERLADTVRALWRNIVDRKLYVTGGVGATAFGEAYSYDYDLPNDLAYSETCAAIALVFFARRMLELEPKSEYADVMELALYNTVLAGMAMDGKSFFYVNPLEVRTEAVRSHDARFLHIKDVRQKWFGCACCPPNLARLVESVQEYAYTLADDGGTLFTHLYIDGMAVVHVLSKDEDDEDVALRLEVESGLPWNGHVRAVVHVDEGDGGADDYGDGHDGKISVPFIFAFRLPAWAGDQIEVAACTTVPAEAQGRVNRRVRDGYLYLAGTWRDGDVFEFDFPMPVMMLEANLRVSEDAGKVAFVRGPVVYCAEECDNGSRLHCLHVDAARVGERAENVTVEPFDFKAGAEALDGKGTGGVEPVSRCMVRLRVPAWRDEVRDAKPLYSPWHPPVRRRVEAVLIPYFAWANRGENEMRVFLDIS